MTPVKIEVSKGVKCGASWQVIRVGGAYVISCRKCGSVLLDDYTPKCLLPPRLEKGGNY